MRISFHLALIGLLVACVPDDSDGTGQIFQQAGDPNAGGEPNPGGGNQGGGQESLCGDGHLDSDEECDDGNRRDGDGCDHRCTEEEEAPRCGDGRVDPGEACDDGNTVDDDACSNACRVNDTGGGGGGGDGCLLDGEGNAIGDRLKDLRLTNCNGDTISLHQSCGTTKAQLVVLSAEWCTACDQVLPDIEGNVQRLGAENLNAYYVLGETNARVPPTQAQCLNYARSKGLDPARTLMDSGRTPNGQEVSFKEILYGDFRGENRGWVNACLAGTFGLPMVIVLDGQDFTYVHTDSCAQAGVSNHADWVAAVNSLMQP